MKYSIIVAANAGTNGIGRNGTLPWKIAADMEFFKTLTTTASPSKSNVVIMGRKTYESIPIKFRPLPDRINIVLSHNSDISNALKIPESVYVAKSLSDGLELLKSDKLKDGIDKIFIIGGESVYREAILSDKCDKIYLTEVIGEVPNLDTYFPVISASRFRLASRSAKQSCGDLSYRFTTYEAISDDEIIVADGDTAADKSTTVSSAASGGNSEEQQYLDHIRDILDNGVLRGDRTGTGTLSKFGIQMRFSLRDNVLPLLTTKRVFWRGVAEELIWFVAGRTNGKELSDKGIHIWDGNGSREFLDSRGLGHRAEGDLGPVYGFQWRHFGAAYEDMNADYSGRGVDQLADCVHKIKTCPEDRRIIMTAWNPADLDKMALPPCHMFCQFYVANGELSCQMYQRSADMGLGVPFNIASYSLLTAMVAQVCGLKCGDFVHTIGDAHVYVNHVDALREQLLRSPKKFPTLRINPEVTDIDAFQFSDFTVENYTPDAAIKMKMAV